MIKNNREDFFYNNKKLVDVSDLIVEMASDEKINKIVKIAFI